MRDDELRPQLMPLRAAHLQPESTRWNPARALAVIQATARVQKSRPPRAERSLVAETCARRRARRERLQTDCLDQPAGSRASHLSPEAGRCRLVFHRQRQLHLEVL